MEGRQGVVGKEGRRWKRQRVEKRKWEESGDYNTRIGRMRRREGIKKVEGKV